MKEAFSMHIEMSIFQYHNRHRKPDSPIEAYAIFGLKAYFLTQSDWMRS